MWNLQGLQWALSCSAYGAFGAEVCSSANDRCANLQVLLLDVFQGGSYIVAGLIALLALTGTVAAARTEHPGEQPRSRRDRGEAEVSNRGA